MGKYESILKCIQIHRLADEKKFKKAMDIVETLNVEKIVALADLKVIADIYVKMEQYDKARVIYSRIYNKVRTRRALYRLIILTMRSGNHQEAEELYKEYENIDNDSVDRLILFYRLQKAKGGPRKLLIQTLEKLKKQEYMEEWAYELAKLYHKEGMAEKCVQECKDIALWFGDGEIVKKAKILKKHYDGELDLSMTQDLQEVLKSQISKMMEKPDTSKEAETLQEYINETKKIKEDAKQQEDETVVLAECRAESLDKEEEEVTEGEEQEEKWLERVIKIRPFQTLDDFFIAITNSKETLHFVIAGDENRYILAVVKKVSKLLMAKGYFADNKIARIHASKLNDIDLEAKSEDLKGGCMLVEEASLMNQETRKDVVRFMDKCARDVIVILTDKPENMAEMLLSEKGMKDKVSHFLEL